MRASATLSLSGTIFYMLFDHYQCITIILTCLAVHCTRKLPTINIIESVLKLVTTVTVAEVGVAALVVMALGMYVCKRILIVCLI